MRSTYGFRGGLRKRWINNIKDILNKQDDNTAEDTSGLESKDKAATYTLDCKYGPVVHSPTDNRHRYTTQERPLHLDILNCQYTSIAI